MELLPISFIAGVLTILAPCILPVLPIIIGSSLSNGKSSIVRPLVITGSLGLSIIVFTLILKASTALIAIPDVFWKWFSAVIIFAFAFSLLFPSTWGKLQSLPHLKGGLKNKANRSIATHSSDESLLGAFLIGIALGPVFAACSPTFFIILGTVLPASFGVGLLNLIAYALGLTSVLLLIAFTGQRVMGTLNVAANPNGWFKKGMGILFLVVGLAIVTGFDKKVETYFVQEGFGVTNLETDLIKDYTNTQSTQKEKAQNIKEEKQDTQTQIKKIIKKDSVQNKRVTEISGTKLPIPSSEILAGGPPKDGIPPLDTPKFIVAGKADWLNPADEGVGIVDSAGVATFYPFRVLVWHEIVNTQVAFAGKSNFPVSITYCPLCKTAVVFEGMIDGVPTTFGTSGKLWQSNLLMYDRNKDSGKESLWSQVLGTAVSGPRTGIKLSVFPSTITTFIKWKGTYPQTKVLSKDTGFSRNYSQSPYGGYDESSEVYFPTNFSDSKTHPKTRVLGLEVDGNYIAFEKERIKLGKSEVVFAGNFIVINRTKGDTITFKNTTTAQPISFIEGFWFSWQAVHPSTELRS